MRNKLVAYFSASGITANIAKTLAQAIGADLYEIVPAQSYTSADLDWRNKQSRSTIEMNDPSSRPAVQGSLENMADYDTVFVGFPIWWYSCPMAMLTFVEEYDFSGKTVIPFVAHGTGGISGSVRDMSDSLPEDATVLEPIGVYRPDIAGCKPVIEEWLAEIGLAL